MRIKSIIAGLVAAGVLMTNGVVFAQENNSIPQPDKPLVKQEAAQKRQELAQHKEVLKEKQDIIKANREKIAGLRNVAKDKMGLVKQKVKALKKNPEALTEEKVAEIKEKLSLLRDDKVDMAATYGLVKEQLLEMKLNRQKKDITAVVKNLDNIITIQEKRIDILKKLNDDIDRLLAIL